jgi:hypothetical protein
MRYQTLTAFGLSVLGFLTCARAVAQQSPIDQALAAARQVDGTTNVQVEILQNDQNGDYDCHGRNARVMGNGNRILFHNCDTVSVPGNQNTVNVYSAELIKVYGSSNTIRWAGDKKPETTIFGSRNRISQIAENQSSNQGASSPSTRTGGPPIVIDQSTQSRYEMDCDGRDVKVQAADISVVLHGECGAIYIQGADDQVRF